MALNRLAGVSALGFVAIVLSTNAVLAAGHPPAGDTAIADVTAYFSGHATEVRVDTAFAALAWVMICVFAAGAVAAMWPLERARAEAWSIFGLVGVVMQTVLAIIWAALRLALTTTSSGGSPSDAAVTALWQLHNAAFALSSITLAIVLTGFSIGGARTAILRSWQVVLGLTSAVLLTAGMVISIFSGAGGPAGLSLIGLVGWLLWLVWLAGFGVVLLRAEAGRPRPAAQEA